MLDKVGIYYLTILSLLVGACDPAYAGHPYRICPTPYSAPYVAPYVAPIAAALPHPGHPDFETATVNALYQQGVQERQQKKFALALQALTGSAYGDLGPVAVQGNGIYVESYRGYGSSPLRAFSQQTNPHVYANQFARATEGAQALHAKVLEGGLAMADRELALEKMRIAGDQATNFATRLLERSEPDQVQKITTEFKAASSQSATTSTQAAPADGDAVLQARCIKCHTAANLSGGVDLTQLATFSNEALAKCRDALLKKKMPVKKVGDENVHDPLSPAELGLLLMKFADR